MTTDKIFHDAYKQDAFCNPLPTAVFCRNCGTRLKVYYAEGRLYAVKCAYCETVTLVRAANPVEAAEFVGSTEANHTVFELENRLKECENGYAATLHLERSRIANQREEIRRLHKHVRSLEQSRDAWRDKAASLGKQLHETLYGGDEE